MLDVQWNCLTDDEARVFPLVTNDTPIVSWPTRLNEQDYNLKTGRSLEAARGISYLLVRSALVLGAKHRF
jgi:hypothetical protein